MVLSVLSVEFVKALNQKTCLRSDGVNIQFCLEIIFNVTSEGTRCNCQNFRMNESTRKIFASKILVLFVTTTGEVRLIIQIDSYFIKIEFVSMQLLKT